MERLLVSMLIAASAAAVPAWAASDLPLALKGYDVVSYFKDGGPVKGSPDFSSDFDGARYLFANAEHRRAFAGDPDRYTPRFSALCTIGVAQGKRVEGNPLAWKIVDGNLYVFGSQKGVRMTEEDPSFIGRAHEAWPTLTSTK